MAIGGGDFTTKQQKGFGYYFNCEKAWATIEPFMKAFLQTWGDRLSAEENAASAQFQADLALVIADLKDDPSQMAAVKATLGI